LFADLETQTSRGCNSFVRPDEEKMKEVWSRTKHIVGKDSRNKARTQRKRRNLMTAGGAATAAAFGLRGPPFMSQLAQRAAVLVPNMSA